MRLLKDNVFLLILLGSLSWVLTMIKSGWEYSYGLGFWGANGHDGIWHLALINQLAKEFPNFTLNMPVFAGESLKNYHLAFDWLLAGINVLTGIPTIALYFQIIPPILGILTGILTYKFVLLWRNSKIQAFWATFFVYFGSGWGWLVSLIRDGHFAGESMFWSQQAISTLINPPFAMSLIFLLCGIIFLTKYLKFKKTKYLFFLFLFFVSTVEVKIYGGLLGLGGLVVVGILELIKHKNTKLFLTSGISIVIGYLFFKLSTKTSGNLLIFQPFWFLETMMGLTDRLGWLKYHDAMTSYRASGNWVKMIPAYVIALIIFWFGNLGTRGLKEIWLIRKVSPTSPLAMLGVKEMGGVGVFMVAVIAAGILIPTFFLQKGTPWNTIQFLYYSLFFSSILAGVAIGEWFEKKKNKNMIRLVGCLVVILTLPTTVSTLWYQYLPSRPPAKISKEEVDALSFLIKQQEGVVLTYPFDEKKAEKAKTDPPRPLYLYESTAYVSALSAKPVYLEDQVNLDITDYNWRERREKVLSWLETLDQKEAYQFLRNNNIKYVYWVKGQRAKLGETQLGISRVFENKEVDIYRVD